MHQLLITTLEAISRNTKFEEKIIGEKISGTPSCISWTINGNPFFLSFSIFKFVTVTASTRANATAF